MKWLLRISLVVWLCTFTNLAFLEGIAAAETMHYVCVPCGLPCDSQIFDAPGICPKCGMALVDQATLTAVPPSKKVAILVFTGVEIIDYTGPYEVFGAAGYDVYTVAETKEPITTAMGMMVIPKYSFADMPAPDVVVVPGGGIAGALKSAPTLKWLTDQTARDQHTLSVCNGAFFLAAAGLLDGLKATTTSGNIDRLRAQYPKVTVVSDQRFVDNGKIITSAGLSAGIDGALHVVSLMLGEGMAQQVALSEEYEWRPGHAFVRAALADRLIPRLDLDSLGKWEVLKTEGDRTKWDLFAHCTSELSAATLMDRMAGELESKGKWAMASKSDAQAAGALARSWNISDHDGKRFTATLRIESVTGKTHEYTAELTISPAR